jgi:CheY-like chemotaxis protein
MAQLSRIWASEARVHAWFGSIVRVTCYQRRRESTAMTRVLVADNDADALYLAVLDLRLEGHTVVGAPDGESALAMVGDFMPDVVVLDYRMPPGPSGLDVGVRLRADQPDLRIVIYSNYQDVNLVRRAAEFGIPFLPKGNLRTLRAAVAT